MAEAIWEITPPKARDKADRRKLNWALRDAAKAGDDLAEIQRAAVAYYGDEHQHREDGRYAVAPKWFIDDGLWRKWAGRIVQGAEQVTSVEWEGKVWTVPAGGTVHEIGTMENPGIRRQLSWMEDWKENPARWKTVQGPTPGQEGCRVWPDVIDAFVTTQLKSDAIPHLRWNRPDGRGCGTIDPFLGRQ